MDRDVASLVGRIQPPGLLRHLSRLSGSFTHRGRRISYIHIYARPDGSRRANGFEFITARESGFEGIACVDDVARAAVLALQTYELTGAESALSLARDWLGFVEYMQEPDGRFTNFIIDETGAKNLRGQTSRTGGLWWTGRAMWALATAYRVTGASRYLRRYLRGRLAPTSDMKIKAMQALALMELYQATREEAVMRRITALCDAVVSSGPHYFHDKMGQTEVAMWGYHQLHAVARAARLFDRLDYIAACERTVTNLVEPVVDGGFYHVYPSMPDHQCAYDVSTLALGLGELYRATSQERYRELALRCAAWLDGTNSAGVAVYDARTGRCSDGITHGVVSLNCGAESAIEAGFVELMRRQLRVRSGKRKALALAAVPALLP